MSLDGRFPGMVWFGVLVLSASVYANAAGCEAAGVSTASASMRMISARQDPVLHSKWGLVVDCANPEWPGRWVLLTGDVPGELKVDANVHGVAAVVRGPLMVRAGEMVRAWRRDSVASIETSGVAEQSGVVGARIQVRLVRRGVDGESVELHLSGVVDGLGSVELR